MGGGGPARRQHVPVPGRGEAEQSEIGPDVLPPSQQRPRTEADRGERSRRCLTDASRFRFFISPISDAMCVVESPVVSNEAVTLAYVMFVALGNRRNERFLEDRTRLIRVVFGYATDGSIGLMNINDTDTFRHEA